MRLMIFRRIVSAGVLGLLAAGLSGIGSVAAASSNADTSIHINATPVAAAQVKPGQNFTSTFKVSNLGDGLARDVRLVMTYPSAVQVQAAAFDRTEAWVNATTATSLEARLGDIGSHGGMVKMVVSFLTLPGYTAGTPLQVQVRTNWNDIKGKNKHNGEAVPILVNEAVAANAASETMSGQIVTVNGSGFKPGEPVHFWYNVPGGSVAPLYIHNGALTTDKTYRQSKTNANAKRYVNNEIKIYADANGRINITFNTAGLAPGSYSIVACGMVDDVHMVVPFVVSGPATVSSAAKMQGDGMVAVNAGGFKPGEPVQFWYNRPDGGAATLYIHNGVLTTQKTYRKDKADANGNHDANNATTVYADAKGQIGLAFNAAGLAPGNYSIVARGLRDGVQVVTVFAR